MKSWWKKKAKYKTTATYIKQKTTQAITVLRRVWKETCCRVSGALKLFWSRLWFKEHPAEARFAGWVARLTFILCGIGIIQTWAFIKSERGFVAPVGISFNPPVLTAGQLAEIRMTVKNGGKDVVQIVSGRSVIPDPHGALPGMPHYEESPEQIWYTTILPGDTSFITIVPMFHGQRIRFDDVDIAALKEGNINMWLYGYITYRDRFSAFLGSNTIGFCYHYQPLNDPAYSSFSACGSKEFVYIR